MDLKDYLFFTTPTREILQWITEKEKKMKPYEFITEHVWTVIHHIDKNTKECMSIDLMMDGHYLGTFKNDCQINSHINEIAEHYNQIIEPFN